MKITFCGHGQVSDSVEIMDWLRAVTRDLIKRGGTTFYLGGYGEFDSLAAAVLREQKKMYPQIELILVLPYLNASRDAWGYDGTIYLPLESSPPRFAISKRNQWMVDASDVVVAYVLHNWGGAAATLQYAKRKKKEILSYPHKPGKKIS
ncbi:MAG TPA: hypothetical protein IAB51_01915 [Candidatus Merdivicinus excrementipullorum]|uniref:DUF1273 domain-containing protein n=1 Tax=Candidatus Merdivicinus excrementipullorum TaxID=2840867 RepID=A0A9D1FL99_9FIRM|nr:hypothetical protein [Candidatus Merdivicinus excrementipullorum]